MGNNHDENHAHHITPLETYLKVAGALFALTFLTVIAHHFNNQLGVLAAPIAFLIATVKAVLVMLWFMHLKYDSVMNRVIFGAGFFFLALLLFFSGLDIWTRVAEFSTL
ncbi:MAG: cytochrome C oxidase subunit IV family protein [Bdellovibrionaceae bacterium]|nr:cytochrome C oxidase subunit IV family protein [Pseudobdellovibrionaceae bacterium]